MHPFFLFFLNTSEGGRLNKVGFRNCTVFRNWSSETISLYSETISLYSETISSYSETISSYSETISSYSETIFVVFRNYFRRIQKLLSLMLRNFYYQTRGRREQPPAWSVDAFSCIQGGVGGGAGAVSFRRWLCGPMLSWVRVGWGGEVGGVGLGQ